jgi:hypothetical protein
MFGPQKYISCLSTFLKYNISCQRDLDAAILLVPLFVVQKYMFNRYLNCFTELKLIGMRKRGIMLWIG